MSLGGVRLDTSEQLLVIRAGEIDPAVRWIYAVESAHCFSLPPLRPIAGSTSVRRTIRMRHARIMRDLPQIQEGNVVPVRWRE